jgi:hypothetical protein
MGVSTFPQAVCKVVKKIPIVNQLCKNKHDVIGALMFTPNLQDTLAVAGYFRDPDDLESYKKGSTFLASLNNEIN